ncbi:MAG: hypothetical protein ABIH72_05615 [archaeon]
MSVSLLDSASESEKTALDELVQDYSLCLFDTSALICPMGKNERERRLFEEEDFYKSARKLNSAVQFYKYLEALIVQGENILVTQKVLDEFSHKLYFHIKKFLRQMGQFEYPGAELCEARARKVESKGRRGLVESIQTYNKILDLSLKERGMYNRYHQAYFYLPEKFKLSEADIDVLISGAVLANTRGKTCIISNDTGISRAWRKFMHYSHIEDGQLDFFIRGGFIDFSKYDLVKHEENARKIPDSHSRYLCKSVS